MRFIPLGPEHFFAIDVQDSQRLQYGLDPTEMDWREAQAIADNPDCWAAIRPGRGEAGEAEVIACLGINETFPGVQGVAFAFFGKGIGRDHLAITRFARDRIIGASKLRRIEAIVKCADVGSTDDCVTYGFAAERMLREAPLKSRITPQVRWALDVGLEPVAVLRNFGALSETHMLLERVN